MKETIKAALHYILPPTRGRVWGGGLFLILFLASCGSTKKTNDEAFVQEPVGPTFIADSAMAFCQAQCDFGPRTMNSKAHDLCEDWIADKFAQYGLQVTKQKADLKGWDGTMLRSTNIIARFNPEAKRRIIICAHWDSRPWADNDPDSTNWRKPVMAANDGASGVGVMLEVARLLQNDTAIVFGIDFICFDAEDYGTPQWAAQDGDNSDTWTLGSQYFAQHANEILALSGENASYDYGILLDMVGGQGAQFYRERFSMRYAAGVVDKVWAASRAAQQGSFFVDEQGGYITDDHYPLNMAGIPCIDIIPYYPNCEQSSFGPTWHTINDDMQHLDPATFKAVGQTLIQVIYGE